LAAFSVYHKIKISKNSFYRAKQMLYSPKGRAKDRIKKIARDNEPHFGRARSARKGAKSMGGAMRRPQNGSFKAQKSGFGVVIQPSSNLFYQKFLRKRRFAAPSARLNPPSGSAPLTRGKQSPQKFLFFF
jgi:hypothetical protein